MLVCLLFVIQDVMSLFLKNLHGLITNGDPAVCGWCTAHVDGMEYDAIYIKNVR